MSASDQLRGLLQKRADVLASLQDQILYGDCREKLQVFSKNTFSACVTDPPYELGFMGKSWDQRGVSFDPETWRAVYRVLKPGGFLLCFGGTRTFHRIACAIEDAGFEIRDTVMWVYGCLSDDTEILVDGQWEPYHKAIAGKHTLCYDVDKDTFAWQPIEETYVYDYNDTAYRIQSDQTDQIVSRNHRCLVERGGEYVFEFAEEIAREQQAGVPVLESVQAVLNDLPLPDQGAGCTKEDVFSGVCSQCDEGSTQKEAYGGSQDDANNVSTMWEENLETQCVDQKEQGELLQQVVQGEACICPSINSTQIRQNGYDFSRHRTEGQKQSRMEGGSNILSEARELQADQVCAMPSGVSGNGSQRQICDGTSFDCCKSNGASVAENGSCASSRSRSSEQFPQQSATLCEQSRSQTIRASRYTKTDLARITPIYYEGIVWCVKVPTGAFVARRNGKVFITGNSGFPKSLDISKAIDKVNGEHGRLYKFTQWMRATGLTSRKIDTITQTNMGSHYLRRVSQPAIPTVALWLKLKPYCGVVPEWVDQLVRRVEAEREVVGDTKRGAQSESTGRYGTWGDGITPTAPATDAAKTWHGYGTALKPAYEPIIVAMKPLAGTFAENALKHGVAGINVDGGRVEGVPPSVPQPAGGTGDIYGFKNGQGRSGEMSHAIGRFPANLIHDGSEEVLGLFPETKSGKQLPTHKRSVQRMGATGIYGASADPEQDPLTETYGDQGSAARFFYCAKSSKKERGEGNNHPTVKPQALMEYLVKLVKYPEENYVLDPFCGSGTTLVACQKLGVKWCGIDQDIDSVKIARKRVLV